VDEEAQRGGRDRDSFGPLDVVEELDTDAGAAAEVVGGELAAGVACETGVSLGGSDGFEVVGEQGGNGRLVCTGGRRILRWNRICRNSRKHAT
jgi:hypothetical protein